MGFVILESSCTFNPTEYGLSVGDYIHVLAVGGGAGGGVWNAEYASTVTCQTTGTAGGSSSFGSYVTALGGLYPSQGNCRGGVYGNGAGGWYPRIIATALPVSSVVGECPTTGACYSCVSAYGGGGCQYKSFYQSSSASGAGSTFSGSAGRWQGVGADGATSYGYCGTNQNFSGFAGGGGAGYGAGGGSASYVNKTADGHTSVYANDLIGGNSGEVKEVVVRLTNLDPIPVTVGAGGVSTTSTFKSAVKSGAGADGCVCIFW